MTRLTSAQIPKAKDHICTFTAFQFRIVLPEGVSVATDEDGFTEVELSNRTSSRKHTLDCVLQTDGSYLVLCYSTNLSTFSGDQGTIMSINLDVDDIVEGDYVGEIRDVILTRKDKSEVKPENFDFLINVTTITSVESVSPESTLTVVGGNNQLTIKSDVDSTVNVYSINGLLIKRLNVTKGTITNEYMPTGVYVVNNKKVLVY